MDSCEFGPLVTNRTQDPVGGISLPGRPEKAVEQYWLNDKIAYAEVGGDLPVPPSSRP